jgi:transcriptional regulator with PAS, ATPase and Fis domain
VRGAFTGAMRDRPGRFQIAHGGTIFLDEIGELDVAVQSKILRVIQERRFERIGGNVSIEADVRIICATNRNLEEAVKSGTFRDDLYFRINVFPVTVPPLRARREDIDALIDFFLQRFARELGRPGLRVTDEARALLRGHDWPGNIRELQNYIERAAILCDHNTIEVRDVGLPSGNSSSEALREALDLTGTLDAAIGRTTHIIERMKIQDALQRSPNRNAAAELLGISTRALSMKLKELEIE